MDVKHPCCLKCVDEYMLMKRKINKYCKTTLYLLVRGGEHVYRPARWPPHPVCQTLSNFSEQQHDIRTCADQVWFTAVVLEDFSSRLSQLFYSSVLGVTQQQNFVSATCQTSTVVTATGVMLPANAPLTLRNVSGYFLRFINARKTVRRGQNTMRSLTST